MIVNSIHEAKPRYRQVEVPRKVLCVLNILESESHSQQTNDNIYLNR